MLLLGIHKVVSCVVTCRDHIFCIFFAPSERHVWVYKDMPDMCTCGVIIVDPGHVNLPSYYDISIGYIGITRMNKLTVRHVSHHLPQVLPKNIYIVFYFV